MRHRLRYLAMDSRPVNGVKSGDETPEGYFEAAFATIARYEDLIRAVTGAGSHGSAVDKLSTLMRSETLAPLTI